MEIRHLHLSSRWDRPGEVLRVQIADWMQSYDLITLTNAINDGQLAWLRDLGWDYYDLPHQATICWNALSWAKQWGHIRTLSNNSTYRMNLQSAVPQSVVTAGLKSLQTQDRFMVSVTAFPPHMEGQYADIGEAWAARKIAWSNALGDWSQYVDWLRKNQREKSVLACADLNVNLKDQWARDMLRPWMRIAWTTMPGSGGALFGGPTAPEGSPGKGVGDRIYDGSLYDGLLLTVHPVQLDRTDETQHRAYAETFSFEPMDEEAVVSGVGHGQPWWGFGDHLDDELYE